MSYNAIVGKIELLEKVPNADRLQLATVYGTKCIVGLSAKIGDIGILFDSGGELSDEYCKNNNLYRNKEFNLDKTKTGYIDENRRVRAMSFRGCKSDGLFMPLTSISYIANSSVNTGFAFTEINGHQICKKYIKPYTKIKTPGSKKKAKRCSGYHDFYEHIETEQFHRNKQEFRQDDLICITLKLHGTSGRTSYTQNYNAPFYKKWFNKNWETVSGSRRVVLDTYDGGFYGSNAFRKTYHDYFTGKLKKGETVYYEIVGYAGDTPIMGKCSNNKVGKEFVAQYGGETVFDYGCKIGQNEIYVYRITQTMLDNTVRDLYYDEIVNRCKELDVKVVPLILRFVYGGSIEGLVHMVDSFCDGKDLIGNHIREGIVVRIENRRKFTAFKAKNISFKILEGAISEVQPDAEDIN